MKPKREWWIVWLGASGFAWILAFVLVYFSAWIGAGFEGSLAAIAMFMAIKRFRQNR